MGITHVIRGDDHLSNTPRQLYIYNELDWEPPRWCHLAMILGSDGERLSKRHGATDVQEYKEKGYLPEAMVNGMALLGWSPPDGVEVKKVEELVRSFSLERVNKSASRFDYDKVKYLNGQHLRSLPADEIVDRLQDFMPENIRPEDEKQLEDIVEVFRDQLQLLTDFAPLYEEYFQSGIEIEQEAFQWLQKLDNSRKLLEIFRDKIAEAGGFEQKEVEEIIAATGEEVEHSGRNLYLPMRIAVTGKMEGPEFHELMPRLGIERCLTRVDAVLDEF